jgi:hypothetical protein
MLVVACASCVPCAMGALFLLIALLATTSWAGDKEEKDEVRLQNAGTVLKEILNIPDDITQDLLDKAACVVVSHRSSRPHLWLAVVMAAVR